MAKSNAELAAKVDGVRLEKLGIQEQLERWKSQHLDKLSKLAGNQDTAEKIFVICMNTVGKNPDLLQCTFESIANCILQSFQLNLFPGPFQECGYVPLENGKLSAQLNRKVIEANFWPQYQGLVKLMRNAGNRSVVARVVFENDMFQYHEIERGPVYIPAVVLRKKRGQPLFVYASVCNSQGMYQVEVMDLDQINQIKSRSRGAKSEKSPWNSKYLDDQYAMWSKTCLKRLQKWCTKSPELVTAIQMDNVVDGDIELQKENLLDLLGNGEKEKEPANVVPLSHPQPEQLEDSKQEMILKTADQVAAENQQEK